jgi:hypothetical protein
VSRLKTENELYSQCDSRCEDEKSSSALGLIVRVAMMKLRKGAMVLNREIR